MAVVPGGLAQPPPGDAGQGQLLAETLEAQVADEEDTAKEAQNTNWPAVSDGQVPSYAQHSSCSPCSVRPREPGAGSPWGMNSASLQQCVAVWAPA